jgi:CRISPR system Cascade subunit CasD
MKVLTIRLTAPLQSYGDIATFNYRTTGLHPSKSAMIGMIAAALGYRRDDCRIKKLNQLKYAVRVDQPGTVLRDFQTVEWKWKNKSGTKLTYRDYLQDAVFMVAVGSDDSDLMSRISYSLKHPRFSLFLGRRSNPVAGVLETDLSDSVSPLETLRDKAWQASRWYQRRNSSREDVRVEVFYDSGLSDTNKYVKVVKDEVISFESKSREYQSRMESSEFVNLRNPLYEKEKFEDYDAMSIFD